MKEILETLGLNEKEIALYLALVSSGKSTATQLAQALKVPRQTVYYTVGRMLELGAVDQTDERGVRKFVADPYKLEEILEAKRSALGKCKESLKVEIPKLVVEQRVGLELPKVQYYQGREGLERLFRSVLKLHRQKEATEFVGYGINYFYPGMEKFLEDFVKERFELGVRARVLLASGPDGFNLAGGALGREFRKIKIPEQRAAVYLVGGSVFMFSFKDNVGVRIDNRCIVDLMKAVFENDWEKAEVS